MSNQSDFLKIDTYVIKPMIRHWSAVFEDKDLIEDFIVALRRFDNETLQKAMQFLSTEAKRKPTLAHIVEACKANKTISKTRAEGSSGEWLKKRYEEEELKKARASMKAKNYCESKFREISDKISDWPEHLKKEMLNYIAVSAQFQAEGIERISNRGYMNPIVMKDDDNFKERQAWWLKMCSEAIEDIHVAIPWGWLTGKPQQRSIVEQQEHAI